MATGIVFYHRFYMNQSFKNFSRWVRVPRSFNKIFLYNVIIKCECEFILKLRFRSLITQCAQFYVNLFLDSWIGYWYCMLVSCG